MSEKSLEEKQREFDAWRAGQKNGLPDMPPGELKPPTMRSHTNLKLKITPPKVSQDPASQVVPRQAAYVESMYVSFLRFTGILCFLGALLVLFMGLAKSNANLTTVVMMVCCMMSGVVWLCAAHGLALIEEMHLRKS